ncbi:unnamed protein product [Schistocephalus solidus]|uniref:Uncharacterized protein n=1 Tax=Schistocephalus solidus TaxID=70667 RepID=A0A183TGQ5_SCHSO|nr:unnamed protein product [Schistocephalus solidus]
MPTLYLRNPTEHDPANNPPEAEAEVQECSLKLTIRNASGRQAPQTPLKRPIDPRPNSSTSPFKLWSISGIQRFENGEPTEHF